MNEATIQHKSTLRTPPGFAWESGAMVPIADCDSACADADDIPSEQERERLADGIREFLRLLVSEAGAKSIGQRALALAFLMGITDYETRRDLAKGLNISGARVTQIIAALPSEFHSLAMLRSRKNLTSRH